ncbi:MAG: helix-turn-helix transcriptional regulator [Planctomycetota bacterium]|nr:helix-turn-helix transcriptional regulator [Planctomycetota bacterium]
MKELQGHVAHFHCCKQAPPPAKGLHVGERIRELRKGAGLTQAQLAKAAGIPAAKLSEVERGKAELDQDQLGQIASYLGVITLDVAEAGRPLPTVLEHPAAGRGEPEAEEPPPVDDRDLKPVDDRDPKPANVMEPDHTWAEDLVERDAGLDW